jgi:Family of unknown function (DUF6262)
MQRPERNTTGLAKAGDRRSERAVERARQAVRRLDRAGEPVSFQSVAREAGVSRQFLYGHDQLRREIERLRAAHLEAAEAIPPAQRAGEASLKARNQMLLDENRRLRAEVTGLREELAGAWGELRALQRQRRRTGPGRAAS